MRVGAAERQAVGRTEVSSSKLQRMARITVDQLFDLPSAERVELAQALWDSVAQNPENVPLTEDQRLELDRRLEAYAQNPTSGVTWESIKRSLRGE